MNKLCCSLTVCILSLLSIAIYADIQTFTVNSLKKKESFSYTMQPQQEETLYTVYKLTYPTPFKEGLSSQQKVFAEYFLPKLTTPTKPVPAVICLHILGGRQELTKLICSYLATQGIPALMPYMPGYGPRKNHRWNPRDISPFTMAKCFDQGTTEISRAFDILASRKEVNAEKISIEGISLGAILATIAGGKDERFYKMMILLGGGDFKKIIGNSRETMWLKERIDSLSSEQKKEFYEAIDKLDPLFFAPNLVEKADQNRIMMINAEKDEVIPPECSRQLASKMNMANKMEWLKDHGHYTAIAGLPGILKRIAAFATDNQIPQNNPSPQPSKKLPLQELFIQNLLCLLDDNVPANRCRLINLKGSYDRKEGTIKFIRGSQDRFFLECNISNLGYGALGYGAYPWLRTSNGTAFEGTLNPDHNLRPGTYINSISRSYYNMLKSLLMLASATPDFFSQYIRYSETFSANGHPVLTIRAIKNNRDKAEVIFDKARQVPQQIRFDINNTKGNIVITNWNMNAFAADELFAPPESKKSVQVDQKQLDRLIAAFINFAGDMVK